MHKILLRFFIIILLLCSTFNLISKEKIKTVVGTLPNNINFYGEDPPCKCDWTDYFILNIPNSKQIIFSDDDNYYIKKYYKVLRELKEGDSDFEPYGGTIYVIKNEFINKTITVKYKVKRCPSYKDQNEACHDFIVYKNYIVSTK